MLYQMNSFYTSYHINWRFVLILLSHLRLRLSSGIFPWGLLSNCGKNFCRVCSISYPHYLPLYDCYDTYSFGEECKLWRSQIYNCPHLQFKYFSLPDESRTSKSMIVSLRIRDKLWCPNKTKYKIINKWILIILAEACCNTFVPHYTLCRWVV
jgi:hypothetical protein